MTFGASDAISPFTDASYVVEITVPEDTILAMQEIKEIDCTMSDDHDVLPLEPKTLRARKPKRKVGNTKKARRVAKKVVAKKVSDYEVEDIMGHRLVSGWYTNCTLCESM